MNTLVSNQPYIRERSSQQSLGKRVKDLFLNSFVDIILPILRITVETKGELPAKGPLMIVANHNSHADTPILIKSIEKARRNKCRVVASKEYFFDSNKLSRRLARIIFPLVPATASNMLHSLDEIREEEQLLIIYPEGTRGLTTHINTFKPGIKTMLENSQIPVVPVAIKGSREVLTPACCIPKAGHVIVSIGEVINPEEFSSDLVDRLENEVKRLYEQI